MKKWLIIAIILLGSSASKLIAGSYYSCLSDACYNTCKSQEDYLLCMRHEKELDSVAFAMCYRTEEVQRTKEVQERYESLLEASRRQSNTHSTKEIIEEISSVEEIQQKSEEEFSPELALGIKIRKHEYIPDEAIIVLVEGGTAKRANEKRFITDDEYKELVVKANKIKIKLDSLARLDSIQAYKDSVESYKQYRLDSIQAYKDSVKAYRQFRRDSIREYRAYIQEHKHDCQGCCHKPTINSKGIKVRKCRNRDGYYEETWEEVYNANWDTFSTDETPIFNKEGYEIAKYQPETTTSYGYLVCSGIAPSKLKGKNVSKLSACNISTKKGSIYFHDDY